MKLKSPRIVRVERGADARDHSFANYTNRSVLGRPLCTIYNEKLNETFGGIQFESKLFLNRGEDVRN